MTRHVAIVDYGMGNLRSVWQALLHAATDHDIQVEVTADATRVRSADRVVLPGQGAMRDCMRELDASGLREAVVEAASAKPLLGICVGMQMLLDASQEQDTPTLGLVPGRCVRFNLGNRIQADGSRFKVPQMGWNRVRQVQAHALWRGIDDDAWFYFVHSFHAAPSVARHSVGDTDYGGRFTSAIARDNIFATQFHPEKSAQAGLRLYRNFLDWSP